MHWGWLSLWFGLGVAGCTSELAKAGERCTRSAQCVTGLACIEGRCSDDLDALRDQSTVPMLMMTVPPPAEEPQSGEPAPPAPADDDAG